MILGEKIYRRFPRIGMPGGKKPAFGGNQAWYGRYTARETGCGPVAAANLFAYWAADKPRLAETLGLQLQNGVWAGQSFLNLMEASYRIMGTRELGPLTRWLDARGEAARVLGASRRAELRREGEALQNSPAAAIPPSLGNSGASFVRGLKRCAAQWGPRLAVETHKTLFNSREEALVFLRAGLSSGQPMVLLTEWNRHDIWHYPAGFDKGGVRERVREPHFITLVGLAESAGGTELIASDAGQRAKIPFDSLWRSWQSPAAAGSALFLVMAY